MTHWTIEPADVPRESPRGATRDGGGRSEASKAQRRAYQRKRSYTVDPSEKRMIAWDGEGMKLWGPKNPQSYVLFGCSALPDSPLMIQEDKSDLRFFEIVDYACDVADQFPNAFHVGYYFAYDQNMIIKYLTPMQKMVLHEKNAIQIRRNGWTYRVKWVPKKRLTLTRVTPGGKRTSLTIDDMAAFFASSFVKAYQGLYPEDDGELFARVVEGKSLRADMLYRDMPRVLSYWQAEIVLLERLAERFRSIMYDAGFILREWYGPGALANYIRREHRLAEHEWGGKEANMPADVHEASKRAYFGGRFEQFAAGRVRGPIYAYDIRSAYPAAFAELPSLREGGTWQHVERPTPGNRVGVYKVRYRHPDALPWTLQPLPHRAARDANVTYPGIVQGWYWTPEAAAVMRYARTLGGEVQLLEGWEWWPADRDERPWAIFREMYEHRARLKRMDNPMQMAFKLGPNSMYGKMAQRIGFDAEKGTPPRAHTLPIAGWITAYCRGEILSLVAQMPPGAVVAIETDGVYSLTPPDQLDTLDEGEGLGQWDVKCYDEMLYVQSGVYLCKQHGKWETKSRGMDAQSVSLQNITAYLQRCGPGEQWEGMELPQKERFIGLGAAIARSRPIDGKHHEPNPYKLNAIHCRWETKPRTLIIGDKGKRVHVPAFCPACKGGKTAAQAAHRLIVHAPAAQKNPMSAPYLLPWERDYVEPEWLNRQTAEHEEIAREQT